MILMLSERLHLKIALIQTIPVSFSDTEYVPTSSDLLYSSPLLLFSALVVQSSCCPDNEEERESFILARYLYNGITNNKHVPSNVIVSYANENNQYNTIKNNLQKTVLSVIERLKIGSSRVPHIVASDIDSVSVNFLNVVSQVCLNEHFPERIDTNSMPQTTEQKNLFNTSTCTIPTLDTRNNIDACANNCDPVISVSTTLPLS
ncbi:hypothetical protein F8M41_020948 [Gigaspora margarita]|uniref:Uncharacterized protein n=1 Tax=Gigaspora margarita TaxID=4874 RepID=A0A8H4AHK8_GIGMA|nr:hypothetical protein F8M41_020948 [Gigaspora margarita]